MISMFVISNTVSWSDVMYQATRVQGVDLTPSETTLVQPYASAFFIISVIIGNFFLSNLFVGVIITTYNREKESSGKNFMLTEEQKKWVLRKIMIIQAEPK
jgi:Ion transport protein